MALSASVCRPTELGALEIDQWHRMQAAAGLTDPFLSAEFAYCVGVAFPAARVAVIDDGPDRVGFLPFMARRFRTGDALAGYLANIQGFVAEPGDWTLERVLRAAGIERFEFARWVAAQSPRSGSYSRLEVPVIDLSDGFASYLRVARQRGGRLVKTMDQKRRSEERRDPELRFDFCGEHVDALAKLFEWKSQWLRRMGLRDIFADPRVRELMELTTAFSSPAFRGGVSCLRSGERVLAVFCDIHASRTLAGWMSAYDPAAAQRSPGSVGLLCNIEAAAAHGIEAFHLGPGGNGYKAKLATGTMSVLEGHTGRLSRAAVVAGRLSQSLRGGGHPNRGTVGRPRVRLASRLAPRR